MSSLETFSQSLRPEWLANYLGSETIFATHAHEVLYSFVFYNMLFLFCPVIGRVCFGSIYTCLVSSSDPKQRKLKLNFDIHIIAMIQAIISIGACIWLFCSTVLNDNQLLGYDYSHTFVSSITVGYFIWDLLVCLKYFDLFGFEFLLHAVASLFVFSTTFMPFFQYWVPRFLIFEASSPFVNINWFIANSKGAKGWLSSTTLNVVNGLLLMLSFFSVRIIWGFYAIYLVMCLLCNQWNDLTSIEQIVASIVVGLNFSLDVLNLFWFKKMVRIAKKMASKGKSSPKNSEKKDQ
ncbi:Tda4 protein [Saccharomycopsis crataegensis]|uniref:Tda4 protein n=1 Tax=Saccharomycopsis crataegensis TaxID=43959 RepID=A0AAV5QED6_9ASCO|nr:Tda4 protein [Saccharomycopsis crataegensis]